MSGYTFEKNVDYFRSQGMARPHEWHIRGRQAEYR